ncbi:MAG: glycosyltransferase family 4 protein [Candidatus Methanoperedens sp.]|nr:glycosyltransferase family 4 protein [Candidatus Methanoperedens sp.]
MQQINVLHVIDHTGFGGAQTIVRELLNRWESNNIKLKSYALRKSNPNSEYSSMNVSFLSNNESKYSVHSFFDLKKIVKAENIKFLHLHLPKSIVFGILLKTFYCRNLKIIVHEHGEIFENKFLYSNFLKLFQNKSDLFIAISGATKRKLIENAKIKKDKIKVLYNFVDIEYFDSQKIETNMSEGRKKLGLNKEDFVLGFAGRHVEVKGCRDLILAIEELKNYKNIKILISGDGPKKEEYIKLVKKLGLNKNILFLGYVPDIKWFYSIIDCLVIPSHYEPFGMVLLEAQAMQIPVISANVESLNEIVLDRKTGLLFKPKDKKDLAKKIELIYTDENLRTELTKRGLENVKKYSLKNYLTNLEVIYNGLL